jgi:2-methylfumaryl-CoA isomerase
LLTGPAETDRPVNQVLPAWDLLAGLHAALGLLAAERVRARTGRGQLVRVALADVAVTTMAHLGFVAEVAINGQGRSRDGNHLYGSFGCDFPTADGQRIMLVTLTRRHWGKLIRLTGMVEAFAALERSLDIDLGDEGTRYRFREAIAALLAPWFAARSLTEVGATLDDQEMLWGRYRRVDDLVSQPDSLLHRSGLFTSIDHPGLGSIPTPRSVLRFDETVSPTPEPTGASLVGADTDAVLSTWLELALDEIADLRARGVVGGPPPSPRHEADAP